MPRLDAISSDKTHTSQATRLSQSQLVSHSSQSHAQRFLRPRGPRKSSISRPPFLRLSQSRLYEWCTQAINFHRALQQNARNRLMKYVFLCRSNQTRFLTLGTTSRAGYSLFRESSSGFLSPQLPGSVPPWHFHSNTLCVFRTQNVSCSRAGSLIIDCEKFPTYLMISFCSSCTYPLLEYPVSLQTFAFYGRGANDFLHMLNDTLSGHYKMVGPAGKEPKPSHRKALTGKINGKVTRVRTGCLTCRGRRKKCDERKPGCRNCEKAGYQCQGLLTTGC